MGFVLQTVQAETVVACQKLPLVQRYSSQVLGCVLPKCMKVEGALVCKRAHTLMIRIGFWRISSYLLKFYMKTEL